MSDALALRIATIFIEVPVPGIWLIQLFARVSESFELVKFDFDSVHLALAINSTFILQLKRV